MCRLLHFLVFYLHYLRRALSLFRSRIWATRELKQNHLPNCQYLKGIAYGSEDIAILPNGLALITIGPETLYASSDHYFTDSVLRIFEKIFWFGMV
uniref:Uncharacterized protein n=1 Tax=Erpetoichthys calabaricus TaxID=27687 RepID=A0A8C4X3X7_ERPCA